MMSMLGVSHRHGVSQIGDASVGIYWIYITGVQPGGGIHIGSYAAGAGRSASPQKKEQV